MDCFTSFYSFQFKLVLFSCLITIFISMLVILFFGLYLLLLLFSLLFFYLIFYRFVDFCLLFYFFQLLQLFRSKILVFIFNWFLLRFAQIQSTLITKIKIKYLFLRLRIQLLCSYFFLIHPHICFFSTILLLAIPTISLPIFTFTLIFLQRLVPFRQYFLFIWKLFIIISMLTSLLTFFWSHQY